MERKHPQLEINNQIDVQEGKEVNDYPVATFQWTMSWMMAFVCWVLMIGIVVYMYTVVNILTTLSKPRQNQSKISHTNSQILNSTIIFIIIIMSLIIIILVCCPIFKMISSGVVCNLHIGIDGENENIRLNNLENGLRDENELNNGLDHVDEEGFGEKNQ